MKITSEQEMLDFGKAFAEKISVPKNLDVVFTILCSFSKFSKSKSSETVVYELVLNKYCFTSFISFFKEINIFFDSYR